MGTTLSGISLEFSNEIPIIELPCVCRPSLYHYGSESNYQRFRDSYFIRNNCEPNENIKKHIITDVKYNPDDTYYKVDGMAGKCWVVTINDDNDNVNKYYIRNWSDIVEYYKEKEFVFIITE